MGYVGSGRGRRWWTPSLPTLSCQPLSYSPLATPLSWPDLDWGVVDDPPLPPVALVEGVAVVAQEIAHDLALPGTGRGSGARGRGRRGGDQGRGGARLVHDCAAKVLLDGGDEECLAALGGHGERVVTHVAH